MSPPRNTEPQANGALARALMRRHPLWDDGPSIPNALVFYRGAPAFRSIS